MFICMYVCMCEEIIEILCVVEKSPGRRETIRMEFHSILSSTQLLSAPLYISASLIPSERCFLLNLVLQEVNERHERP